MEQLASVSETTRRVLTGALSSDDVSARDAVSEAFTQIRDITERLAEPLEPEDQVIQSMPDVSPTRWHRAHTTWFFETFLLSDERFWAAGASPPQPIDPTYDYLFNSYYQQVGPQFPRNKRGLLSRPTCSEVARYRQLVDRRIIDLVQTCPPDTLADLLSTVTLGLHHEQQHQELLLMDIKHVFFENPLMPAYGDPADDAIAVERPVGQRWSSFEGGEVPIGTDVGFHFDNEGPAHNALLIDFELCDRPVTAGDWQEFIEDGGYERPELWLSDGWATRTQQGWGHPLYWFRRDEHWYEFTLYGPRPLDLVAPVVHISGFEADAYARWSSARLPTEFEWEHACRTSGSADDASANLGLTHLRPRPLPRIRSQPERDSDAESARGRRPVLEQMLGDVWEWTASPYVGYPRYRPAAGAIGEYNGKFMSGQMVLRGGAAITPPGHIRATYRNFFPPHSRWQFGGLRLARDAAS